MKALGTVLLLVSLGFAEDPIKFRGAWSAGANDLLAEFLLEAPIDPLPRQFRIPGKENDSRFIGDADRYRGKLREARSRNALAHVHAKVGL